MPPINYERLASEWKIMLDFYDANEKTSLKKMCGDDNKAYNNCIGHNKVLRALDTKEAKLAYCNKKIAEYKKKSSSKSDKSDKSDASDKSDSALRLQNATLQKLLDEMTTTYQKIMEVTEYKPPEPDSDEDESDDEDDKDATIQHFVTYLSNMKESNDKLRATNLERMNKIMAKNKELEALKKELETLKANLTIPEDAERVVAEAEEAISD